MCWLLPSLKQHSATLESGMKQGLHTRSLPGRTRFSMAASKCVPPGCQAVWPPAMVPLTGEAERTGLQASRHSEQLMCARVSGNLHVVHADKVPLVWLPAMVALTGGLSAQACKLQRDQLDCAQVKSAGPCSQHTECQRRLAQSQLSGRTCTVPSLQHTPLHVHKGQRKQEHQQLAAPQAHVAGCCCCCCSTEPLQLSSSS